MKSEDKSQLYYDVIKSRSKKLISYGIWAGINPNQFTAWLNNFKSKREKYFAALILDRLIYRSNNQVVSMLYDLFTKDLQNLFRTASSELYNENTNPLFLLKQKKDPKFRILAAVKKDSSPAKSGYAITNLLVHQLCIREKWTILSEKIDEEIKNGIKNFIFVDDIIATGETVLDVLNDLCINKYKNINFYIAVCTAHEVGLKNLESKYPNVKIAYSELLTDNNSFFYSIDLSETEYKDIDDLKEKYQAYIISHDFKNKKYGYGDLGLLYAFEQSTPNGSLPILYYETEKFIPLLRKKL